MGYYDGNSGLVDVRHALEGLGLEPVTVQHERHMKKGDESFYIETGYVYGETQVRVYQSDTETGKPVLTDKFSITSRDKEEKVIKWLTSFVQRMADKR